MSSPVALRSTYSDSTGAPNSMVDTRESFFDAPELQSASSPNDKHLNEVLINKVIAKGNDPIDLLFEAAAGTSQESSSYSEHGDTERQPYQSAATFIGGGGNNAAVINGSWPSSRDNIAQNSPADASSLSAWNSSKCVTMGFLSADEAVSFVDAFFQNLAPHTLIWTEHFSQDKIYHQILPEEPLLSATILMISTRYHVLHGSASRALAIYDELWKYVQTLIQCICFGQSKISGHILRSISSIEALLLLSEWYPRASQPRTTNNAWDVDELPLDHNVNALPSSSKSWLEDILEPTKQADRLCWMLLGTAQLLGHELGVFASHEHRDQEEPGPNSDLLRKLRMQEILCIYVTQIAARLGFHSMIASSCSHAVLSKFTKPTHRVTGAWIDLMKLTKSIHGLLFSSEARTRELLQSQGYVELLEHFQPLLELWHQQNLDDHIDVRDPATKSREPLRNILFIEYHTVRMYTNSLSIQGMIQHTLGQDTLRPWRYTTSNFSATNLEQEPGFHFVQEVIQDARQILERAIALAQANLLRFHPVRVFHRVIGASIFILKAVILGIRSIKADTGAQPVSLPGLLERTIEALRVSAVDEFHPAASYGVLLERHFTSTQSKSTSLGPVKSFRSADIPGNDPPVRSTDPTETWYFDMFNPYAQLDLWQEFENLQDLDLSYDFRDYQF
ncbi:uncharacterized protein A1O9_07384 [Exophiala aquamarina CBS 119918]|uniref:Transcription factor domain-containing protein n=1 Tax=Exophiala aquamarina CBS 119918 TaxID=1182545 RepID=A0A072PAS1_9EURO|nr:uncharacterized protein A1O9_07384 [Exophiala aquamarina CBS 119918]KEF57194.1 hypothetical protein A1O9_07384 [Exophiala aquamarina CBS 119918]